jgi:hypothetical protein
MDASKPSRQLWHMSHGIVFAGDSKVVYPRLPLERYHSSPALVGERDADHVVLASAAEDPIDRTRSAGAAIETSPKAVEPPVSADAAAARGPQESDSKAPDADEEQGQAEAELAQNNELSVPPFTPLEFKIPEAAFREAKLSKPGSPESFWSYSLYRGPDDRGNPESKIKVHYCRSRHTTERVLQQYFVGEPVLGFDLEWYPDATRYSGPRRNVSLVQLASPTRIALFHVALYPKNDNLVAPSLRVIMEDPAVTKTGVAIKGDSTRLRKFLGIDSRGLFELSHLYKLVKYSTRGEYQFVNRMSVRLSQQVEEYLHLPMFKGNNVRASDWSQPLRMDQIVCEFLRTARPLDC